jgi:transcriptional regulator with XRE-family HTH domain
MISLKLADEINQAGRSTAHPGSILKSIRTERGWTLAQVSQLTDLPIATLSKIENDKISLSYDKLVRISRGLGIDIGRLFGATPASETEAETPGIVLSGRRSITRHGEGSAIETKTYSHLYPAADLLNKQIVPIMAECKARTLAEFGPLIRHSGEEYAIVLDGAVEFHTDLYAPVLLNKGDSIYFDSSMAHGYIAACDGVCRVLSICSSMDALDSAGNDEVPQAEPAQPTILRSA